MLTRSISATLALCGLLCLAACNQNVFLVKNAQPTSGTSSAPSFLLPSKPAQPSSSASGAVVRRAVSGSLLQIGDPHSPHTLLVFTNESCAYCRDFWNARVPLLQQDFVKSGLLQLHIAILPIGKYPASVAETEGIFCAQKQGKGSEMHDALFDVSSHSVETVIAEAKLLKLDKDLFHECLFSDEAKSAADGQRALAEKLHVTLVPTLILDGTTSVGLMDASDFLSWIKASVK